MVAGIAEGDEPTFLDDELALGRIDAIVANARTIWIAQLGFLAFITVTLLSVRDLDFFSVAAEITLPLVGVAIPTPVFFWTAAWLATVLHVYFHLYLLKLWNALALARPEIDGLPLGERTFPWLVNDWALRHRPERPVARRPMDGLGNIVTALLIWLATPLLLVAFWWRSMPAHDARLTLAIGAAILVSAYASLCGWRRVRQQLKSAGRSRSANFTGGRNLTQSQLAQAIGDGNTTLPLDAETGEQLYVWTCWAALPLILRPLWLNILEVLEADLRPAWRCPPGVAAERTGRPAEPVPAADDVD